MKAYSEDLRKKIVAAIERGVPKTQAARMFDVSLSSLKRYSRIAREGKPLEPRKSPGRPRKIGETSQALLEKDVEERPAATISQRRRFLEHISGKSLSDSTVRRLTYEAAWLLQKKRSVGALEREEWQRAAWRVMGAEQVEAKRLVFVDEMGTNISLSALYGWAPKGKRAHWSVPRNRGANTTIPPWSGA